MSFIINNIEGSKLLEVDADNLSGADLNGADLGRADLNGADLPNYSIVPESGAFNAWKVASGFLIKLEVPASARRCSSLIGRKCRAEKAKVIGVWSVGGKKITSNIGSDHTSNIRYQINKTTTADKYDDDPRVECTHGIHFWMTLREVEQWAGKTWDIPERVKGPKI